MSTRTLKKGFTLIEVMVVLSILAIIAVLAYNFFGGTMKEATLTQNAAKIADDMRVLDDGYAKHYLDASAYPANYDELVTDGVLKAKPTPPKSSLETAFAAEVYTLDTTGYTMVGTAAKEHVALLKGVTDDVCKEVNNRYSDLGAAILTYANAAAVTGANTQKTIFCYDDTALAANVVVKLLVSN